MEVSNFPQKAAELLKMANDVEDNILARAQAKSLPSQQIALELMKHGTEIRPTGDNVRMPTITRLRPSLILALSPPIVSLRTACKCLLSY
jgi:hypothetical protein